MSSDAAEGPHVWATATENWPDAVADLAFPHDRIDLTAEDRAACLSCAKGVPVPLRPELLADIDSVLTQHDDGAHLRFGLGSLKTGPIPPRFRSAGDFVDVISRCNSRLAAILHAYETSDHDTALFCTRWRDIPKDSEFRIFLRDGALIGASQYHTDTVFPGMRPKIDAISRAISVFLTTFSRVTHTKNVVADVYVHPAESGSSTCTLLELNPLIRRTDACMFDWSTPDTFDGSLKYRV
ncbi:hypothetical protein [Yoonia sp. 2307UL14-13]|uniref:hypothetical protein n=1 Tax=Yoonia sp. 2307UL14-13 TaxID=3126506 RepID=UPI0030B12D9F